MSTPVIEVDKVTHLFKDHRALNGISFEVGAGTLHGFVGPNGAGKTTTLKLICTLLRPQTGRIRVFGMDVRTDVKAIRQKLGYMPDHFSMYKQMTVYEYLDFFAAAYGHVSKRREVIVGDVLSLTDMEGRKDDLIQGLSRGMQQRVSLARVLVNDPDLLLLDEPASGLDPRARIELMEILRELRRMGKTIFISSHILSELATLCDHVTIMDRGTVKYTGTMRGLITQSEGTTSHYQLTLAAEHPAAIAELLKVPGVLSITPPLPTEHGFRGQPTLVNNVETLVNIPWIVRHGAEAFKSLGFSRSRGTKAVSLNSLFRRPGLYEVEFGVTVRHLVEELGGGLRDGAAIQGLLIGGPLAGILGPRHFDTPFGFEELQAVGACVGHGGIVAFDSRTSLAELAHQISRFAADESCGKCTPCRLGSRRLEELFARACPPGAMNLGEEREVQRLTQALQWSSLCGHGRGLGDLCASAARLQRGEDVPCRS